MCIQKGFQKTAIILIKNEARLRWTKNDSNNPNGGIYVYYKLYETGWHPSFKKGENPRYFCNYDDENSILVKYLRNCIYMGAKVCNLRSTCSFHNIPCICILRKKVILQCNQGKQRRSHYKIIASFFINYCF